MRVLIVTHLGGFASGIIEQIHVVISVMLESHKEALSVVAAVLLRL